MLFTKREREENIKFPRNLERIVLGMVILLLLIDIEYVNFFKKTLKLYLYPPIFKRPFVGGPSMSKYLTS